MKHFLIEKRWYVLADEQGDDEGREMKSVVNVKLVKFKLATLKLRTMHLKNIEWIEKKSTYNGQGVYKCVHVASKRREGRPN